MVSGYGLLETLVICSGQIMVYKIHINFNWSKGITKEIVVLVVFISFHKKKEPHLYLSIFGIEFLN